MLRSKNIAKGFTLIEMMVSIVIFSLITGIVMFNHGKFNSSIVVTNLSYEVALAVREAQVYGLAVRQNTFTSDPVEYAYGVYFEEFGKTFYIFADKDGGRDFDFDELNDQCEGAEDEECVERIEIRGDVEISNLVINDSVNVADLTVLFLRPNPVALIYGGGVAEQANRGQVILYSERADKYKQIVIELSGQISVQDIDL